jgi:putative membrane protein
MLYLWIKLFHLLFVLAWMAAVFYLPRILVNVAETPGQAEVQARLLLMGHRLYRFGHHLFGVAFLLGLVLYVGHYASDAMPDVVGSMKWIHAKLALVVLMMAFYVACGRALRRVGRGGALPSSTTLRWLNEIPLLLLVPILWLVLFKPF